MQKYEGTLKFVKGDVTNPQRTKDNEIVIIPHIVNNLKVMGAGVAYALKKKWPQVFETYKDSECELGTVSYSYVLDNGFIHTLIANMVGQDGLMNSNNPKPIKYLSVVKCMENVSNLCKGFVNDNPDCNVVIHMPEFGSLRAGGNFDFILELVKEIWIGNGIDVVVYQFEE